jgi:hypothetical protein
VGAIGTVVMEGASVWLEKTAPADLEDKQQLQLQYAKLNGGGAPCRSAA